MDFAAARENMVEGQIRPNQVTDERLIAALRDIPREAFVPDNMAGIAYVDEDIDLGNGCFLMEPLVLARLIQAAGIEAEDIVLDIGCGTGYSAAVMGRLAATVVGIEQDRKIAAEADELVHQLDITNVAIIEGDLTRGYPEQAPYEVIVINGSVPEIPSGVAEQLGEGGRLVAVVRSNNKIGQAVLVQRIGGVLSRRALFDASTPVLKAFQEQEGFIF